MKGYDGLLEQFEISNEWTIIEIVEEVKDNLKDENMSDEVIESLFKSWFYKGCMINDTVLSCRVAYFIAVKIIEELFSYKGYMKESKY